MDRLVKQLITPFITEQVKAKKVIAVYPGRFQPFGPHHKKVFQALQKKFGEVYITTSDIKAPPRHPMNFKEKVRHMVKMGIPKNRIVKERVPYVANNLLKRFDAEKTAVIYVFGAKDAGRLKGGKKKSGGLTYYQDFKKNKNKMVGYETHGYIYTAPHVNVSGISSGTEIRKLLGSPKVKEQSRKIIFKKTFGYFDQGVYNMLTNKFRKLFEVYSKFIVENKDYIKKLIKEASTGANFPTDDGPPTFYKGFTDYEKTAGNWVKEMGKTYGWEVYDYLISQTAQNPEDDYTLEYNIVPSVAFGRENTGDYGKRFGVKEPIKRYIEVADRISKQLGYEVIKYMGIKPDLSGYTGVEVESPVLPGRYDLGNTERAKLTGKQLGSGMTLLNTLEESLDLSNEIEEISNHEEVHECIAFSKKFGDDIVIGKNRDRNYTPELKVVREISGNGNEVCYVQDQDTDWSEGMNSNGIGLVNSALFVKRDEKDFDKAKKKKAPSKDGIRIRHALSKDTFAEVVESLVKFDTGVKGHTLVSDGKKLVVIENTSRTKPSVKIHDIDKSSIVRTNHGIKHPEQGYTRGPDRISSELRLNNAKKLIDNEKEYKKVFPLFYNDTQSKGPKFDLVRAQNKLWTSSQILMNLNKKELILYLIPGAVKFIGIENKLPKNYEPKIKLDVRQFEHGPSDKYDTFVTTDKTPKKSAIKDKSINENLLLEGGAYGHMSHPFDDNKLTFADLKKIIKLGLSGELNREDAVTEKTDGQNLMITYRDGKVLAARNKGQIKNRGQNALDAKGVAKKFSGRGDIRDAFVFAMSDLTKSINSLSDKQKDKIFKNGEIFMNLEIIYPASSNVIDYDKQILQFHNSIKYDKNGNAVGEVKGSGRMLQGMIKQVNQDIGKHFKIIKPRVLDLPKKIDFGKKVDIYNKRVDKLKNQYGLKDNDTLGKYHQSFWEEYIFNAGQQFGYRVPKTILKKLTKRWAFFDKSYKIPQIKNDLKKQPKFLDWVMNTDKQNHKNMVKKNMLPFEKIFFSVGADILLNLSNFIAANPTKAVEKIRKDVIKASNGVRAGGDIKKMNTLKQQLEKLNSIGGLKKIVPVEGVVFKYKGKTYKFTGAFAPVNQILGLVSF